MFYFRCEIFFFLFFFFFFSLLLQAQHLVIARFTFSYSFFSCSPPGHWWQTWNKSNNIKIHAMIKKNAVKYMHRNIKIKRRISETEDDWKTKRKLKLLLLSMDVFGISKEMEKEMKKKKHRKKRKNRFLYFLCAKAFVLHSTQSYIYSFQLIIIMESSQEY